MARRAFAHYRRSLPGTLLDAREATLSLLRPTLRKAGLTEPQWRVMRVIEVEGECEPTDAAQLSLIQLPSLTRIMRDLTARDLIERNVSPLGLRRSTLKLTPQGRVLLNAVAAEIAAAFEAPVKRFGEARLASLMSELRALSETFAVNDLAPTQFS